MESLLPRGNHAKSNGRSTRQRKSLAEKGPVRTYHAVPSHFLRQSFSPVMVCSELTGNQADFEKAFFGSLKHLRGLYPFTCKLRRGVPFPQNIYNALEQVQQAVWVSHKDIEVFITVSEEGLPCLATAKMWYMSSLYYVPIRPVSNIIARPGHREFAELLISVLAYLYQGIGVPYFRDDGNFLHGCYSYLQESLDNGESQEDETALDEYRHKLEEINSAADEIQALISDKRYLHLLEDRANSFVPGSKWEQELQVVAIQCCQLRQSFPDVSLLDGIPRGLFYKEEQERIGPEQYIGMVWDDSGDCVSEYVWEEVNVQLQECCVWDTPCCFQRFDQPQSIIVEDFGFPVLALEVIEKVCSILYNVP